MIAQHRIYPTVEKSLGHCVSLWTDEPYHKQDGIYNRTNESEQSALLFYCAKDVHTMRMVYKRQLERADCLTSMQQAMNAICAYMPMALRGLPIDLDAVKAEIAEHHRWLIQIQRIAKILTGIDDSKFLGSNKQLASYFYGAMGMPIMDKTATGQPSIGRETILKLRIKFKHPILDLCIQHRNHAKAAGDLNFFPFSRKSTDIIAA